MGQGLILCSRLSSAAPFRISSRRSWTSWLFPGVHPQHRQAGPVPHVRPLPTCQESQYAPIPERDAMEKLSQEGASCAELFNGLADGTIEGYMLKPMNCPHHIQIYANDAHSYRDLPVRLAEFGTVTVGNRAESWAA
ncbi:MAG: hypothetical protein ACLT8E_11025 [Akkermansia sp.]